MAYENNDKKSAFGENTAGKADSIYSKRIRAGKRRTYFFDVRATRGNDYYLTITESRKRFDDNGYDRHKVFLYKEDFNKFIRALGEAVDYVKTELMPDFDFDAFNHDEHQEEDRTSSIAENGQATLHEQEEKASEAVSVSEQPVSATRPDEEVDKW